MKRKILAIVALTLALSGCGANTQSGDTNSQTNTNSEEAETLHYTSSDLGIELDYPSTWNPVDEESAVTFYYNYDEASGAGTAYVNLSVADISGEETTLDEVKDEMVANLESDGQMSVDDVEAITVSGTMPAYKLSLSAKNSSGNTVKFTRMLTVEFGCLYLLTYSAREKDFDSLSPDYDTMLSSFKIQTYSMDAEGNITPEN